MTEIKFKVYNKNHNKFRGYESLMDSQWFRSYNGTDWQDGTYSSDIDSLVRKQFTGRKDKNESEIYEGDILYVPSYVEHSRHYVVDDFDTFIYENIECMLIASETEIVGNIYENPELLEVK